MHAAQQEITNRKEFASKPLVKILKLRNLRTMIHLAPEQFFVEEVEEGFRDRETRIIRQLVADDNQVVALGGGAVLREENRRILAAEGRTLWLRASVEAIHQRLAGDLSTAASRPDLTSQGGFSLAHLLVDTAVATPLKLVIVSSLL